MGMLSRMRSLFGKDAHARDLDEELEFHLAMRAERNRAEGMEAAEARRRARVRFGNPAVWRERMSEIDVLQLPQTLWQDVRFGARMLLRHPGYTLIAVFALGLGIGINTAAFTAYRVFVTRKVDARKPEQIVNLAVVLHTGAEDAQFSYPDYEAYRDHLRSFSGVIATSLPQFLTLKTEGGVAAQESDGGGSLIGRLGLIPGVNSEEKAFTMVVSENFFDVLGVGAIRGRVFRAGDEARLLAEPSVLISENYWKKRFGCDANIIGRRVRLNDAAFTIIGVTPHNFAGTFVSVPDFWLPASLEPLVHPQDNWLTNRDDTMWHVRARLAPGATMREAQEEMSVLANHLRTLHHPHSDLYQPVHALVWPGSPTTIPLDYNPQVRIAMLFVLAAVELVLLVACANVASLQLARATARQSELSMRLSLGASRWRLVRQLLTESLLLAVMAGCIAFLLSMALLQALVVLVANAFPEDLGTFIFHVNPDLSIFGLVLLVSLAAGIFSGLVPAFDSSRSTVAAGFKSNAATSPRQRRGLRRSMIATQVAVSAVLLIAGAMLIHGAVRALRMATGYDDRQVVDLSLEFPETAAYTPDRKLALVHTLNARLAALPGVAEVTSGRAPDDSDFRAAEVSVNGEKPSRSNTRAFLYYTWIEPNYFSTLGIPLLVGTGLPAQGAGNAIVVSESAARALWPGPNPVGKTLQMSTEGQFHDANEPLPDATVWRVVGVSRDTRGVLLDGSDSAQIYLPMPESALTHYPILVRTRTDPVALIPQIEPVLASVDPNVAVRLMTLEQMLRMSMPFVASTMAAGIAGITGLLGLVLVMVGIYGTVSYVVVQRTREVGIRMALGARQGDVLKLILADSVRPVVAGLGAGLVLAVGAAWLLRHVLYGVHIIDAVSFGGASVLLLAVALLAAVVPSRRATRVDPMVALRYE